MENRKTNFKDYLNILKRQRKVFISSAFIVCLLSILTAVLLPPIYSSSATILLKEAVSEDFDKAAVTTYAEERIEQITQRVLTRTNLVAIINKYNLYWKDRDQVSLEKILQKMREHITLTTVTADVIDSGPGLPAQTNVTYTLTFNYQHPVLAQKVAHDLTALLLQEQIKPQTDAENNASLFLMKESRRLKNKIHNIQKSLATFKEQNLNTLPEINVTNQQQLISLNNRMISLESQENILRDKKAFLQNQLSQISSHAMAKPATSKSLLDIKNRLKKLESQFPILISRYATDHPDVLAAQREIESLQSLISKKNHLNNLNAELVEKQAKLVVMQQKYSPSHPDVLKLKKQIEDIQKNTVKTKAQSFVKSSANATSPVFASLQSQLKSVNTELKTVMHNRETTMQKIDALKQNLRKAPLVEENYLTLVQELENATQRYQKISAREMEAEISQQLERESQREAFTLIEPPYEPSEAVSPNRPAILMIGFILAVVIGVAAVGLIEALDDSVHTEKNIAEVFGAFPLASIPYLEDRDEYECAQRKRKILYVSGLAVVFIMLLLFHFLVMPLTEF